MFYVTNRENYNLLTRQKGIIYVLQQDTLQGLGTVWFGRSQSPDSEVTVAMNKEVMNPPFCSHRPPSPLIQSLKSIK